MANILSSDFPVSKNAYLSFDGLSIKEKIRERLNQTGVFSDQNFEGSNISALNDVISMVFSLLIFNLNKTSNEGQFSEVQLYENINRIVKQLGYYPIGHQTANVSFSLSASNLNAGIYTIPRYSSVTVGGYKYSFSDDFSFTKIEDLVTEIINTGDNNILYQGTFLEFPTYTASGNDNEIIYVTSSDTTIIDHFNIDVYVKSADGVWKKWKKTQNLYLNNSNDLVYELRFNENRRYEIKFGNNINGRKLNSGDQVAIYYLKSDGKQGEIGANTLQGRKIVTLSSTRLNTILNDLDNHTVYLNNNQLTNLIINNSCAGTNYVEPESVDNIRKNAPGTFRSQFRLVTKNDYETFIKTNFVNVIHDVKCVNNTEFMDTYTKYFYDLGLTKPQLESRALFNQQKFADSCNFNNVYMFLVPKTSNVLSYLSPSQKSLIIETIQEEKTLTADVIPQDPVYLAVDVAIGTTNEATINDISNTQILIKRSNGSRRNETSIINDVNQVINSYFSRKNVRLGQNIDLNKLSSDIMSLEGVGGIYTKRNDTNTVVEGLRLVIWNPIYPDKSFTYIFGNISLELFQFPYFFTQDLTNRIVVDDSFYKFEGIAY